MNRSSQMVAISRKYKTERKESKKKDEMEKRGSCSFKQKLQERRPSCRPAQILQPSVPGRRNARNRCGGRNNMAKPEEEETPHTLRSVFQSYDEGVPECPFTWYPLTRPQYSLFLMAIFLH